ncbi:hypothetical protein BD410DRAFT_9780 [Rickenella mellea]|uniref:Uncharacterized protein n=1 Tax=Rickenella mellea TaxID=50990 RepID=A0A4R5XGD7_9AGAM|nr:hypothetical protein BD410DRAFT_9780 [Rickenella mellea]
MDSRSPRPPPYSPSPPNTGSRSANDTRNPREPLLRSKHSSYGPRRNVRGHAGNWRESVKHTGRSMNNGSATE